ncbi:MAG TPA: glycosyltransferase [Polyangiaceae bacterium]|nr:glycosyltransferase [Polyangiaceae bacterium]
MRKPRVSVVIPTYNKAPYLRRTLMSWRHQRYADYELVVVDDGSSDATRSVLSEFEGRLPIRCVSSEHGGRSVARNRGLEVARGTTIVFSDDDRIVSPQFLEQHVEAGAGGGVVIGWQRGVLVELRSDVSLSCRQIAAVRRVVPGWGADGETGDSLEVLSAEAIAADTLAVDALAHDDDWFQRFVVPAVKSYGDDISRCAIAWMFGTTGNLSAPAALIADVGGFDESLTGWGVEDTELHYRLVRAGAGTFVSRAAVNYHQNHPRNDSDLMHEWVQNALRMYRKHESLEVALFLRVVLGKLSLAEVDQIVREARALPGSALVANFQTLQHGHVLQLAESRRDTQQWIGRRS